MSKPSIQTVVLIKAPSETKSHEFIKLNHQKQNKNRVGKKERRKNRKIKVMFSKQFMLLESFVF